MKLKVLDLFSGIGGFSLGLESTGGFETIAFCEIDPFCRSILEKHWPGVKIYEDVKDKSIKKIQADVIVGGFPCQDISSAGKGAGIRGAKSSIWFAMFDAIKAIRPAWVVVENSANLRTRGLREILLQFAAIGYDVEWSTFSARWAGAPHIRKRLYLVAYPHGKGLHQPRLVRQRSGGAARRRRFRATNAWHSKIRINGRPIKPGLRPLVDGVSDRLVWANQIKACGNSLIPQIVHHIGKQILTCKK